MPLLICAERDLSSTEDSQAEEISCILCTACRHDVPELTGLSQETPLCREKEVHSASSDNLSCSHHLVTQTYVEGRRFLRLRDDEILRVCKPQQIYEEGDESSIVESERGARRPWLHLYHEKKQLSSRAMPPGKVHEMARLLYMMDGVLIDKKASPTSATYAHQM